MGSDSGTECDRISNAVESRIGSVIELLESIGGDGMLSGMGKAVWLARLGDVSASMGEIGGNIGIID